MSSTPGRRPRDPDLNDYGSPDSAPRWRNQALAWFLSRLQLAQAEGQGMIRTIRSTMQAAGCPPPIFEATEVSVTCILRAHARFERVRQGAQAGSRKPRRGGAKPKRSRADRRLAATRA